MYQLSKLAGKSDNPLGKFVNSRLPDNQNVYESDIDYWSEYIADFDLKRAEEIRNEYSDFEIIRAGLAKQASHG